MGSQIKYTLEISDNGFVKVVKQATDGVEGLDKAVEKTAKDGSTSMKSLTTSIRDVTLAFNGAVQMIGTVYNQMKEFTDASNAQIEAQRNLTEEQIAYSQTLEEQTGVSDVVISQAQSMLKVMGLNNEETQQATKYTADLVNQGKSLEDATKKASAMITHNYGELGELIPAIKTATTEQEKQSLAMDYFARISDKSIEKMAGVEGAEIRMKNAMQDAKEEFGAVINKALVPLMKILTPVVELIGDNMPVAVGILGTVLTAVAIPRIIATTTALYAQATALTMATGGMNLLVGAIASLAVGGSVAVWASMSNGAKEASVQIESISEKYERLKDEIDNAESSLKSAENEMLSSSAYAQELAKKQVEAKRRLIAIEKEYADKRREIQNKINTELAKYEKQEEEGFYKRKKNESGILESYRIVGDVMLTNARITAGLTEKAIKGSAELSKLKLEETELLKKQKAEVEELQVATGAYSQNAKDWAIQTLRAQYLVESKQAELRVLKMALEEEEDIRREANRNEQKVKDEEARLKEVENAKQRNATSLSLMKQYQDKVSQLGLEGYELEKLQAEQSNRNTIDNLDTMLAEKKIHMAGYNEAIKSQAEIFNTQMSEIETKHALKEIENQKKRLDDYGVFLKEKQDKRLEAEETQMQSEMDFYIQQYENEKAHNDDMASLTEEMAQNELSGLDAILNQNLTAYNEDFENHKALLEQKKLTQEQYDEYMTKRTAKLLKDNQKSALQSGKQGLKQMESDLKSASALSKDFNKVAKVAAIGNTTIASIEASMQAYKAMAGIPIVGPALGAAAAAAALLAGAGNVAKITATSQGYRKGGYTGDGNEWEEAGVVHKKEFVNTAETVDRVGIPALEALQDGRATIVPITQVGKPDTFTGSVNTDYIASSVQALSMNLVNSNGGSSKETVVINNSDFVEITRKIEQTKNRYKSISNNKSMEDF